MNRRGWAWPLLAGLMLASTAWQAARGVDGYAHARHALALLGSTGAAGWRLANLGLFVLPGALMAVQALALRARQSPTTPWVLRLGLQAALLAALGHALQGVCNLDSTQLPDAGDNRLHALAWMLWWVGLATSGALLAAARGLPAHLRLGAAAMTLCIPVLMLAAPALDMAAIGHRFGIALWLGWSVWLGATLSRGAASSPGWSATGRR